MKWWMVSATVMMSVVLSASSVLAERDSLADFGLRAGYQDFADGDGAFMGGGYIRLPWHSVIMSEAAIMYHTHDEGDVEYELIPVQLSAMVFVLRRDLAFSPYLLAGVGAYIGRQIDADGDSDTDFDFGWHLGLGLDYNIGDRFFVEGDLRYVWLDLDFKDTTVGDKLSNYNNWMAGVGFGFRL